MRLVFAGTPAVAVPTLRSLAAEHEIVAVVTRPDAPLGRKRVLTPSPVAAALNAYYNGQPIPAGYTIQPAAPDILNPTALPLVGVIGSPYINASTITTDGVDFGASVTFHFANGWSFESNADAEYIHKLNTTLPGGVVQPLKDWCARHGVEYRPPV